MGVALGRSRSPGESRGLMHALCRVTIKPECNVGRTSPLTLSRLLYAECVK